MQLHGLIRMPSPRCQISFSIFLRQIQKRETAVYCDTGQRLISVIGRLIFVRRGRRVKLMDFEVHGYVLEEMPLVVLML